uniref:Alkaline ceramidase n=1 Tax=Salmo trutta TaxID=8032 RepID=A0A674B815_SALTR
MSSLIFFVISPIMLYLLHPYARERNLELGINVCPLPTGLFSAYFHMTLSFMGQMLDEQSILWVLGLCYALWFSLRVFPCFINDRLATITPAQGFCSQNIICEYWNDCFGCILWQKLNFCYLLTCVYSPSRHILIVIAVAYASTLIAYLDANYEIPYSLPGLQYWPSDNCVLGLPYIVLKGTIKTQKRC